jgi:CheY-like chemotaxis protein
MKQGGSAMTEKKHVLVVDDDVQLVDTVKTLLESVGYEVAYAYQAEEGMELARKIKPDLILLDVMFAAPPGPDGIEISRRLHQDSELRDIPVIILTGISFLEKPIKPDKLLAEIAKTLGSGD